MAPRPTHAGAGERFPVIVEMIPYGKDNWRLDTDLGRGAWLAARGYAYCRVDVRGTGSSGGVALDEYTADETRDGYDAVEWAGEQPWSSGAVAMWGISYGAFTAIQVAKLRPPHLRAIVPCMGTDDRYVDDVHYRGGCVTASELSQYAVSQVAMNAMPPDATLRGTGWLEEWRARLEVTPPWLFEWLRHQTDGPYWRQGSLAPDYDAIDVPIYSLGGWMDSYVDPAFRMQERCTAPTRTLVGNWVHGWPGNAGPGPNVDDLHELVRFLDHHLRGIENGVDAEPPVVWFEREYAPPEPFPETLPGRWRATAAYPHPAVQATEWHFDAGELPSADASSRPEGRRCLSRASTDTTHRPTPGRARRCRGEPAARRTAWPATFGPTRAPARRTRPRRLTERDRDPRRPRGRAAPVGLGAGRDGGRSPDRRRAGRDVVPGERRAS